MRRGRSTSIEPRTRWDTLYNPDGIVDRTGMTGNGRRVDPRPVPRRTPSHFGLRGRITALLVVAGVIAVLAIALLPGEKTSAFPTREGGNCGPGCHPYRTTSFLTVTFSPT